MEVMGVAFTTIALVQLVVREGRVSSKGLERIILLRLEGEGT